MYFCSGYFNPPSPLCQAISSTKASVELLSADCRANGFYKAKFPKSGITPAYQLFADHMLEELGSKELNYNEWNRDKVRNIIYARYSSNSVDFSRKRNVVLLAVFLFRCINRLFELFSSKLFKRLGSWRSHLNSK